ncbi:MAG: tetraacyldisaccharide 4'-kinase [Idiomarina sp.]|nr:tetraacyldisaccharide 4'-kinase [Idiomarina sp.]
MNRWWYQPWLHPLLWLLIPLNWLFVLLSGLRRLTFKLRLRRQYRAPVPVIVVGNISVGGTGKTPLTMALVDALLARGFKPGIVSRGYGGKGPFPQAVSNQSDPAQVGDEPFMLHAISQVPVVVSPKRSEAARFLLENHDCNVIISDDGLQHYALARDIEFAVVDTSRGLGNGWRLPCGPLREAKSRLKRVDYVILNGAQVADAPASSNAQQRLQNVPALSSLHSVAMQIQPLGWYRVKDQQPIETPDGESVIAVAGIGNPRRFFDLLATQQLHITETRVFSDHHAYEAADFFDISNLYPLVMTEKDAVKCRAFARPHWYYLKVGAVLPDGFIEQFIQRVQEHIDDT